MERPMMRPMMDPTFVKDLVETKRNRAPVWKWIGRAIKWFWQGLLSNPLAIRAPGEETKPGRGPWKVLLRVAVCWSIALPLLVGLVSMLAVFLGTHPAAASITGDPNSRGVYFETVDFTSGDGTPLTGWLVPAIDAHRVIEEKDRTLRLHRPAMVLAHDYGQSMQEMLPLVQPLHDEGIVVLLVGLRGAGTAASGAAQTFGIDESKDVSAAVQFLRRTSSVDASRVGVAGIGSGANAALIAASADPSLSAIVIANPIKRSDDVVAHTLTPRNPYLAWMQPLCRRVFEITYNVDARRINYDQYTALVATRPTLVLDTGDAFILSDEAVVRQVKLFCRKKLRTQELRQ